MSAKPESLLDCETHALGIVEDLGHVRQYQIPSRAGIDDETIGPGAINARAFSYYASLRRIKRHIDNNPDDPLSLRKAAGIAGYSSKYFCSFFHLKVGVRFTQWYARVRVIRAIGIMQAHNDSVTNIAMDVGFRNLRTFERAFKRHTGITPRQFKKAVRPS